MRWILPRKSMSKVAEQRLLEAIDKGYGNFYSPVVYKLFEPDEG